MEATTTKKELISLIFHFDIKRLFYSEDVEERKKEFLSFVSLLIERNAPFICVFHHYDNSIDFIEDFITKNNIKKVEIEDSWSKGFSLLATVRLKPVKEFWFIDTKNSKEHVSLNGTLPALSFSWFITTEDHDIKIRDEKGFISDIYWNRENLCIVSILSHRYRDYIDLILPPFQPYSFSKYSRPLTKQDIGKRIACAYPRSLHEHITFGLLMSRASEMDISFCIPDEEILEDIEYSNIYPCFVCSKNTNLSCKKCKKTYYCSKECQKLDWSYHQKKCSSNVKIKNSYPSKMVVKKYLHSFSKRVDFLDESDHLEQCFINREWFVIEEVPGLESLLLLKHPSY